MIQIYASPEYKEWLYSLTKKEQARINNRINNIKEYQHFGDVKKISDSLAELRWKNGWRVYFTVTFDKKIILLNGGHKNDQKKDIKKAQIYLRRSQTSYN